MLPGPIFWLAAHVDDQGNNVIVFVIEKVRWF